MILLVVVLLMVFVAGWYTVKQCHSGVGGGVLCKAFHYLV